MKLNKTLILALTLGLSAPAFAGPVGVARAPLNVRTTEAIAQLASAKGQAEHHARLATKGSAAALYRMKVVAIESLMNKLESGEQVSQEEVDSALKM